MIYSEIFDAMPAPARDRVYQKLFDVLSGKDQSPKFAHISDTDRSAILEILRDTKAGIPDYWSSSETNGFMPETTVGSAASTE